MAPPFYALPGIRVHADLRMLPTLTRVSQYDKQTNIRQTEDTPYSFSEQAASSHWPNVINEGADMHTNENTGGTCSPEYYDHVT